MLSSKRELIEIIKELQAQLELVTNNQLENRKVVSRWLEEAAEDQRKIELQTSQIATKNNPFLKGA